MKTICKIIFGILIVASTTTLPVLAAAQNISKDKFQPFLTRGKTTWSVSGGVRVNNFDWNIASDTTGMATPNILSELTWRDITLLEVKGEVRHEEPLDIGVLKGGLHLEGSLSLGMPISGENQDSDYNGDNRTQEFSRTIADSDGGYSVGASAAVGYKIYLTGDPKRKMRDIMRSRMPKTARGRALRSRAMREALNDAQPTVTLTPLVGYSVDQQEYTMTSVNQIIPANGLFPIDDFDWHFQSNWYGPFAGLESEMRWQKNMFRLRGEYHDVSYYGELYWRGRAGFRQDPSAIHTIDGDGYLLNAEYAYAWDEDYALTIDAMYETRNGEDGDNETYFVNNTTSRTNLNEVNDESYGMHIGLRYNW